MSNGSFRWYNITMSIYQDIILDHYRNPRNQEPIRNPTATVTRDNPLCGDQITIAVHVQDDGIIDKISFQANGCAISIAAASLLSEYVVGKSKKDLQKIDKDFMMRLLGIELSVNRLKCALLPLEALSHIIQDPYV